MPDTITEGRKTISVHIETYSQLLKLCAYKQMQTGEVWSMAMMIAELLAEYPIQETPLDVMFSTRRPKVVKK